MPAGGAVGIGRAIVQRLFDEGCTSVYVLDIVADPNTDTPFQGYHYLQVCHTITQSLTLLILACLMQHSCRVAHSCPVFRMAWNF